MLVTRRVEIALAIVALLTVWCAGAAVMTLNGKSWFKKVIMHVGFIVTVALLVISIRNVIQSLRIPNISLPEVENAVPSIAIPGGKMRLNLKGAGSINGLCCVHDPKVILESKHGSLDLEILDFADDKWGESILNPVSREARVFVRFKLPEGDDLYGTNAALRIDIPYISPETYRAGEGFRNSEELIRNRILFRFISKEEEAVFEKTRTRENWCFCFEIPLTVLLGLISVRLLFEIVPFLKDAARIWREH